MSAWKVSRFNYTLPSFAILCPADVNVRDTAVLLLPLRLLEDRRQPQCLVLHYCPPLELVNACSLGRRAFTIILLFKKLGGHIISLEVKDIIASLCFQLCYKVG